MYGYQDSGELAPGKQGGKFGLNTGAFITKFEFNSNAGKDGAAGDEKAGDRPSPKRQADRWI